MLLLIAAKITETGMEMTTKMMMKLRDQENEKDISDEE